ncbi:SDR family NAD(P)-dependent oxidoreductase [Chitinibacter sp. SCUT-21]|uniref:SDR family NAD(P)-dependent oxidoreductase n=1 Tax=Chitinibacter sp. SCUT-21 TaxID=2970891 RepID=UPI0035A64486
MKLAIIIGGSRGLGLAVCEQYRSAGWQVLECSRSGRGEGHIDLDLANIDLSTYTSVLRQLAVQDWDEVVLINNAATITPIKPLAKQSHAALLEALQINFISAISLIHGFVVAFAQHRARKVVAQISSGAAQRPIASWSTYCACKAGLDHFMAVLAQEQRVAKHPILAIVIDPDVMDTDMQAQIRASTNDDFADLPRFIARKEQGLLRTPDEVARFCLQAIALAEQGCRYDIELGL